MDFSKIASPESVQRAIEALKANGVEAHLVQNGAEAKKKLLEVIPHGASVMTMTSTTLDTIGAADEINTSGRYVSARSKLTSMDKKTQGTTMRELGAAPDWAVGSVHAVTEDGKIMVVSMTGSQLPAYAYAADKAVWVVGAQKIVKDMEEGFKRIYEHCLPLESERAKKAYGVPGSSVNKILIINKEAAAGRLHMILVNEALGF